MLHLYGRTNAMFWSLPTWFFTSPQLWKCAAVLDILYTHYSQSQHFQLLMRCASSHQDALPSWSWFLQIYLWLRARCHIPRLGWNQIYNWLCGSARILAWSPRPGIHAESSSTSQRPLMFERFYEKRDSNLLRGMALHRTIRDRHLTSQLDNISIIHKG